MSAVAGVALGLRFEFRDRDGDLLGGIIRWDVTGAAVPREGERFGVGALSPLVEQLVGTGSVVHHIDHYPQIPGEKDDAPRVGVVVHVENATVPSLLDAQADLEATGWQVDVFDDARNKAGLGRRI